MTSASSRKRGPRELGKIFYELAELALTRLGLRQEARELLRRADLCGHFEAADEDSIDGTVPVAEGCVDDIEVHVLELAA